jgi:hypothetical protein
MGTCPLSGNKVRVMHNAAAGMGATFWIPSVVVPALLVTHALVFVLLVREQRTAANPGAA